MRAADDDDDELFLVDCGITTLKDVSLSLPRLKSLNVHSNFITRIENLGGLPSLTRLDLSSNQISRIEGLTRLSNLKHLNLSCNNISRVEGLSNLSCLSSVNLSYNQIIDLSGLRQLPDSCCLHTVQLQGNQLSDVSHLVSCLQACASLKAAILECDATATNPVCSTPGWEKRLGLALPNLRLKESKLSDVLRANSDSSETLYKPRPSESSLPSTTPERLRKPADSPFLCSSEVTSVSTDPNSSDMVTTRECDQEKQTLQSRLAELEKELLRKRIASTQLELDNMCVEAEEKANPSATVRPIDSDKEPNSAARSSDHPVRDKPVTNRKTKNTRSPVNSCSQSVADRKNREAARCTYQQLVRDLNGEQTRRVKAEQAASTLALQIKSLQSEAMQRQLAMKNCDDQITKLQNELKSLHGELAQLKESSDDKQRQIRELETEVTRRKKTCSAQQQSLSKLELVQERLEQSLTDKERKHAEELDKMTKALVERKEALTAARSTAAAQRSELDEMRQLLASREAAHARELDSRYALDSPKLEELFRSKVSSLVREHGAERRELTLQLEKCAEEYAALEDEFRMALRIEADRLDTLKSGYEELLSKNKALLAASVASKNKETEASRVIKDLTALVKEQKEKILTLSNNKMELTSQIETVNSKLEQKTRESSEKLSQLERLKRDNLELKNQVQGQHAIISGLRRERELWSKELAQQGASLSSDRGVLESKIKTLTEDNENLKKRLSAEEDSVKIKSTLVTDLTGTVGALKKKIGEMEIELQRQQAELKTTQDENRKEVEDERAHSASLEQEVDALVKRKEELKDSLKQTEDKLVQVDESYRKLKEKWQSKSDAIATIEQQVKTMTTDWQAKESRLTEERDKAVTAASLAVQKLKEADDGFRKQLEVKELSYGERLRGLTEQYELRIAEEQHKVETVEQEMRELLEEKESSKRQIEVKLQRMNQAFLALQKDIG